MTVLTLECAAGQGATVYPLGAGAPKDLSNGKDIAFDEAAYELGPGGQGDYDSEVLRLGYSSLSTPYSTIDYNMATGNRRLTLPSPTAILQFLACVCSLLLSQTDRDLCLLGDS